jgi:tRNA G10  N-methylase Trm11
MLISHLAGSDIDEAAVKLAGDNFSMLTREGMEKRKEHLRALYEQYKKQNYSDAIKSAGLFSDIVASMNISTYAFGADALKFDYNKLNIKADIVITDVPYGNLVSWHANDESPQISSLLDNIIPCLSEDSVVAICSDKAQKIKNENFTRLEKQQIGKRKFEILKLNKNL